MNQAQSRCPDTNRSQPTRSWPVSEVFMMTELQSQEVAHKNYGSERHSFSVGRRRPQKWNPIVAVIARGVT